VAAAAVARAEDAEREVAAVARAAEQLLQQNRKLASSKSATAQRNVELGAELAAARSSLAAIERAYAPLKPLVQQLGDPVRAAAILRDAMDADAAIEDLLSEASSGDAAPDAPPDSDTGGHGAPPPRDGRARGRGGQSPVHKRSAAKAANAKAAAAAAAAAVAAATAAPAAAPEAAAAAAADAAAAAAAAADANADAAAPPPPHLDQPQSLRRRVAHAPRRAAQVHRRACVSASVQRARSACQRGCGALTTHARRAAGTHAAGTTARLAHACARPAPRAARARATQLPMARVRHTARRAGGAGWSGERRATVLQQ
jgi:SWI/SNF-related matrix-associated actin-dependent regulator 1 of chromatin subfamily A